MADPTDNKKTRDELKAIWTTGTQVTEAMFDDLFDAVATLKGEDSNASGSYSSTRGTYAQAIGNYSTVISSGSAGYESRATGTHSFAKGYYARASGNYSTASGYYISASGNYSIATGSAKYGGGSIGDYSHSHGFNAVASVAYATASGYYVTASNSHAFAKGKNVTASGAYSFAFGKGENNLLIASGYVSFNHSFRSDNPNVSGATGDHSVILGGRDHSVIHDNSCIFGGSGITSLSANTVYVPNLEITTNSVTSFVMTDVVDGLRYSVTLSGGTFVFNAT